MHGRIPLLLFVMATSAGAPAFSASRACQSQWLPAPDNRCAVFFQRTSGDGKETYTSLHIECSTQEGGLLFGEEFLRVFTDRPISLKWLDMKTVEVGLPAGARSTPLRESSGPPIRRIRYEYQMIKKADDAAPLQCDAAADFGPREIKLLSGDENRKANAPGWITYGAGRGCWLIGQSTAGQPELGAIAYRFAKESQAVMPYGTTDLVFAVEPWRQGGVLYLPPEIHLLNEKTPLIPKATGPLRAFLLTGAPAQRMLDELARGAPVNLIYRTAANEVSIAVSTESFAAAYAAFASCISAL